MRDDDRRRAGFTLIEVLLVVAIIGMLATIGVLKLPGRLREARINATRGKIDNISTAIDVYEVDMGQYPSAIGDLLKNPGGNNWHGPYLKGGAPVDPWGNPIVYTKKGEMDYELRSGGPDLQQGSEDDITSFTNDG